jgi:hypothetical protein
MIIRFGDIWQNRSSELWEWRLRGEAISFHHYRMNLMMRIKYEQERQCLIFPMFINDMSWTKDLSSLGLTSSR